MFGQVHDEVDPLVEGGSEIAVEVVTAQVELGNRDEDHVPQAPRCPTTERFIPRPRGEAEELLLLVDTGLVSLRGHEEPHAVREACRPHGLSPATSRTNFMCGAPVRAGDDMVAVTFLSSVQDFQEGRIQEVAERLRKDHADWKVEVVPPEGSKPLLAKYKLQFGPAILVNDRIEFVGIPRYRMLVERVSQVAVGRISPRTAQPPPAAAPTAAAKPAAPPRPTPPPG